MYFSGVKTLQRKKLVSSYKKLRHVISCKIHYIFWTPTPTPGLPPPPRTPTPDSHPGLPPRTPTPTLCNPSPPSRPRCPSPFPLPLPSWSHRPSCPASRAARAPRRRAPAPAAARRQRRSCSAASRRRPRSTGPGGSCHDLLASDRSKNQPKTHTKKTKKKTNNK